MALVVQTFREMSGLHFCHARSDLRFKGAELTLQLSLLLASGTQNKGCRLHVEL